MGKSPRVCFGMSVYNEEPYLQRAISTILNQTYKNFLLIIFNNGSTDGSAKIIEKFARADSRIRVYTAEKNRGMIRGMRLVYHLAKEESPDMEYFAWAAGHDEWHPLWLSKMLYALDEDPTLALVYPQTQFIDFSGNHIEKRLLSFQSVEYTNQIRRFCYVCSRMKRVGNMAYGLYRQDMFKKSGVYRPVLLPDRLLMIELSLHGRFKQLQDKLWYRRESGVKDKSAHKIRTIERQKSTLFGPRKKPEYFNKPWWFTITKVFFNHYVKRKKEVLQRNYGVRLFLSLYLFVSQVRTHFISKLKKLPFVRLLKKIIQMNLKKIIFKAVSGARTVLKNTKQTIQKTTKV